MVEYDFGEGTNSYVITPTDVMTGDRNRRMQLYYQLIRSISGAKRIDIIVSFLMESGVRMLLKDLKRALDRGVSVRILTGNYLGITQPSALYLIKHTLGDRVDLRFYNESERSFHPKAYIFHYEGSSEIFIGSSNISRSALTSGIEWNYRFSSRKDPENYATFFRTFEDLFENHSVRIDDEELRKYSKNWHRPAATKDLDRYDESEESQDPDTKVRMLFEPRGAQIEALCALENARAEGAVKGLVQAATGVGKTYLAAFDSQGYDRVLFVAHREEILKQAASSFRNVRGSDEYGFFDGKTKCTDKPVIFASVATLGSAQYLNERYFPADYFQYIVVDEFHHAVTDQYRRIVDYFKPEFLLGLTATPERMDGRSIYEICDYNVPYEISLKEAINKGMLVPFHYYGIYDDTDYTSLHVVRGRYDEKELNETYLGNVHRHEMIYKHYCKYGSRRAIGFCCSREHAEEMAEDFSQRGIPAAAVYSGEQGKYALERASAIQKLNEGTLRVIFSVDMFNEGVDIAALDMVMFLRPTESPIVFLQQLGRGLRTFRGKQYLNVLDFIGNYEKAGRVRFYLTGQTASAGRTSYMPSSAEYPDDCLVDFDMRLIELFEQMEKEHRRVQDMLRDEYYRIRELLEHRPTRLELFTYMDADIYQMVISRSNINPFKRYLEYLHDLNELTPGERNLWHTIGREFIGLIETTTMTKVYKMPVLMAFYNKGQMRMAVTEEQLLASWKEFFGNGTNWKDLDRGITYAQYKAIPDRDHVKKILQMPVHFLQESGKGFFVQKEGYALALREELESVIQDPAFVGHVKDVIEYRTMDYYQRRYAEQRS